MTGKSDLFSKNRGVLLCRVELDRHREVVLRDLHGGRGAEVQGFAVEYDFIFDDRHGPCSAE
jgi:hypothetical protein